MNAPRTLAGGQPSQQAQASPANPTEGTPAAQGQASAEGASEVAVQRIDPTKKYLIGNSDKPISGEVVLQGLGQAALARKWQGSYDQVSARLKELEPLQTENANLKAQLDQIRRRQEIADFVKAEIPNVRNPQRQDDDYSWGDDTSAPQNPTLDPNAIAEPIYNITKEVAAEEARNQFGDVQALIQQGISAELAKQEEQRAIQQRNVQWGENLRAADVKSFMEDYGYDRASAEQIAGYLDQSRLISLQAGAAYVDGNYEAGNELRARSRAIEHLAITELAKQRIAYDQELERRSLEEQLASGNFVGVEDEGPPEPDYSRMAGTERREARRKAVELAAKKAQARRVASTKLGGISR